MKKTLLFVWELFKVVALSLAIILPVRYFLIQPFFVRGSSMEPNFANGEYLVINEIDYRFDDPVRGEVIVFKYPLNPSEYYIKRIIGLPNETVEVKDNRVMIYNAQFPNGRVLDESSYLGESVLTMGDLKVELREDEYFVLGDNRTASSDSRQWGVLNAKYVVGKVWIRAFPFAVAEVF